MDSFIQSALERQQAEKARKEAAEAAEPAEQQEAEQKPSEQPTSVFATPEKSVFEERAAEEAGQEQESEPQPESTTPSSLLEFAAPQQQVFTPPDQPESEAEDEFPDVESAKIVVLGTGGAGNNAIGRLATIGVNGATTIAVNTDKQHLLSTNADKRILIGKELTKGLGAGGYPGVGKNAAEESKRDLKKALEGVDLLFLLLGLGGGTGTGSAPEIAKIAKEQGAIVIAAVTMPFKIEGARQLKAEEGLPQLRKVCDTVIVIENDRLLEIAGEMPLQQAFAVADEIVVTMIKGITETISTPSLVNLDYADVKAIMMTGGIAVIGVGQSHTAARAREAVEEAMSNPLLDVDYKGATGALIHVSGGPDMKLSEINEIGEFVSKHLDPEAMTIWGARVDDELKGKIRVITIITGVQSQYILGPQDENGQVKEPGMGEKLGIRMV